MFSFQNKIRRRIMEAVRRVIAEAQQHYDFELKGGVRRPFTARSWRKIRRPRAKDPVRLPEAPASPPFSAHWISGTIPQSVRSRPSLRLPVSRCPTR